MNDTSRAEILGVLPGFIPSTVIDVVQPMLDLQGEKKINFRTMLDILPLASDVKGKDLVIFCRNTEPKYRSYIDNLKSAGIPYIYDLDDNFFEIDDQSEVGRFHRKPERQNMLEEYIRKADLVRVYSPVVFGHCIQLNPNTVIVDAPINWRWIHSQPINKDLNQPIKVVYSTSREDDRLWEIFWPAVHRVILKFGAKVEFYFWGQAPAQLLNEKGVHRIPLVKNYNRFLQLFSARMFDIGLAPLPDDAFHRSKTNNKFREYSACGIAGIYSQMDVYRRCVNHRKNGLLVNNDAEAWYQALCELVENVELRRSIQIEARTYAQEHYSQVEFDRVWYNQIVSLVKKQSQNLITSQPKAATLESGPEKHFSKRASLIQLIKKLFHRLLTLPEESSESLVFFLRWALFNAWSLLKVNLLKRL